MPILEPVVIRPLLAEWETVKAGVAADLARAQVWTWSKVVLVSRFRSAGDLESPPDVKALQERPKWFWPVWEAVGHTPLPRSPRSTGARATADSGRGAGDLDAEGDERASGAPRRSRWRVPGAWEP